MNPDYDPDDPPPGSYNEIPDDNDPYSYDPPKEAYQPRPAPPNSPVNKGIIPQYGPVTRGGTNGRTADGTEDEP